MVTDFWDAHSVIEMDFLEHGNTITSERYIVTLKTSQQ